MANTHGMTKAQVLQALYNTAKPQGMGYLRYQPGDLTSEEATALTETRDYFDYLKGRALKVDLSTVPSGEINEYLFDRDYGAGAAQRRLDDFFTASGMAKTE